MWVCKMRACSIMKFISYFFISFILLCTCSNVSEGDENNVPNYGVRGTIQKGPFILGSTIVIQELDENFNPTGVVYNTTTVDDFGSFEFSNTISSRFVEIISTGFYYNEVTGELSSSQLTLRSVSDLSLNNEVNVNVLTTLEKARVLYLVRNEGITFFDAKIQAEKEILEIFNISIDDSMPHQFFENMDISEEGSFNAMLLAISCILQGSNSVAELSEFISKIVTDIKSDGFLSSSMGNEEILANSMTLDLEGIRSNLENRYIDLGVSVSIPNFEAYIDSDGDGLLNNRDFTFSPAPIHNALRNTEYISDPIEVKLPGNDIQAIVSTSNGSIVVNGIDVGSIRTYVSNGDYISVKLNSSRHFITEVSCDVEIKYSTHKVSGTFSVLTEEQSWYKAGTLPYNGSFLSRPVVFENRIWLIGGSLNGAWLGEIWYSTDGISWHLATEDLPFSGSGIPVEFKNQIWLFNSSNAWFSSDGINWTKASNGDNTYSLPLGLDYISYDGKVYGIGNLANSSPLYVSSDGTTWETLDWTFGDNMDAVGASLLVFNNKLWIVAGTYGDCADPSEIWTYDGATWEKKENVPWVVRYDHSSVVFDNKIWVLGGEAGDVPRSHTETMSDVWYSEDGDNWLIATRNAEWSERIKHYSIAFNDRIFLWGGNTGDNTSGDVWCTE